MKKSSLLFSVLGLWVLFLFILWQGSAAGAGFCFILAVFDTMLWLNGKLGEKKWAQSRNYQILQRTFGPFTWLAMYGSLGLLASLVALNRIVSTLWAARIMVVGLGLCFLWWIGLCILVTVGKNDILE